MAALKRRSALWLLTLAATWPSAGRANALPSLVHAPAAVPDPLPACPPGDQPCTGSSVRYSRHELLECSRARHPASPGSPQPLVSAAEECRVRVRAARPCRCADAPAEPSTASP
jgi:hypothetical protein